MEDKTPNDETEATVEESTEPAKINLLSGTNTVIIGLVVIIIIMAGFLVDSEEDAGQTTAAAMTDTPAPTPAPAPAATVTATPAPAPTAMATHPTTTSGTGGEGIERNGEGRLFYRTIKIPAGAETLYLSGTGASMKADGTWGNMEEQAIDVFTKFKATLEEEGWSMADIVQVRAFATAGEYGLLDFDGFNRGYSRFFGTPENPNKPVRSFVQVADLVVDGWLVEVEIRAARVPR